MISMHPELAPIRQAFMDGADFIYGHTALQRQPGLGYLSDWAQQNFPRAAPAAIFIVRLASCSHPAAAGKALLQKLPSQPTPSEISAILAFAILIL
jgi:hypothetical protein